MTAADSGSVYEPHPMLSFEWDPDLESKKHPQSHKPHHPSLDLGPHPADPNHTLNGLPTYNNGKTAPGPNARKEQVSAHEIWVYAGNAGQVVFFS